MVTRVKDEFRRSAVSPLSIEGLRLREYGSQLSIIKEINGQENRFRSFLISYWSDGLKIFARVNIPVGEIPTEGFPAVVFAHGFSPEPLDPNYFQRPYYEAWTNAYAEAGFLVIVPGYRGHGVVEGEFAEGGKFLDKYSPLFLTSPFYAIDVLNLLAGLTDISALEWERYGYVPKPRCLLDVNNLFLSAHSMGGDVALIVLAVTRAIKAASIWAGVVASVEDVAEFYTQFEIDEGRTDRPLVVALRNKMRKIKLAVKAKPFRLEDMNGWNGLFHLKNLAAPLVIHHGTNDGVPADWSMRLDSELKNLGKESTLFLYKGNDHELSLNGEHALAIQRDVVFFKNHLR